LADAGLPESIGTQLERILSARPLVSSPSLSRLLRYLVEETLAGRGTAINEYSLGVDVFQRGAGFNPRIDPIVRVQAHHLRSRLAQYYAQAGAGDPIAIELPARTYMPVFRVVQPPAPPAVAMPAVAWPAVETPEAPPQPPVRRGSRIPLGVAVPVALALVVVVALLGYAVIGQPPRTEARPSHRDPDSAAEDSYIRGRYLLDRQTEPAMRESIDCFLASTARDPQFAAAFAGLADAHNLLAQYGFVPPREEMEEARRAAQHSLSLDPGLAEGHVALASVLEAYDWDFSAAEREYRRAIQLNPQLAAAHLWYGMFLRDQNRIREAMPELRRAEQLEPLSVLTSLSLAYAFHIAGDSDAALDRARRAIELNPELPTAAVLLAGIYRSRSQAAEADATLDRALRLAPGDPHALSLLACTYARLGRREESVRLFHELEQLSARRYVSPFDLGNAALDLGDEDRAVTWFEAAYRERSSGMVALRSQKADSVMHSARLLALIRRIGEG